MIRGLYISASSAVAETKRIDIIANNMANVNTTGYKKDVMVTENFPEILMSKINGGFDKDLPKAPKPMNPLGYLSYGIRTSEVKTNFEQGQLHPTENSFDLAIRGKGFFSIETLEGGRYTRSGDFTKDSEGYLVTKEGYKVLGEAGYIQISGSNMTVNEKGEIYSDSRRIDRIRLVDFNDYDALRKEGNGLLRIEEGIEAEPVAAQGMLQQGFLESSNVNSVKEMVQMLTMLRTYEANQKMVKIHDELLGKAVTEIARV